MNRFVDKYSGKLLGVLNGFDRLVLKGTLRPLSYAAGMGNFLCAKEVLLKDFGDYAQQTSLRVKESSQREALRLDRPIRYLEGAQTDKGRLARSIAEKEGIEEGLICLLRTLEPCISYDIYRNRQEQRLELRRRQRKCLWIYHYWIDPRWGLMSARIQTWFPFDIYVYLNGREWLSRQMDRVGMKYRRGDNCFLWIEDLEAAQRLMDRQLCLSWPTALRPVARRLNPAHGRIFRGFPIEYYWTVHQSEWATDLMFRCPAELAALYPALVRGAMESFCSPDVMRFLGKKLRRNFGGELISDFKDRAEGIRVKHRLKRNSVKMYDKHARVLRVETTINDPKDFTVFRPLEGDRGGRKQWRPLVRGIANLRRLAEVSQASNERYLDALGALNTDTPINRVVDRVCAAVQWKGQRVRALRPWSQEDQRLFAAINRGEFAVNGLRNRDLLPLLFPEAPSLPAEERRRYSARVTRKLRMLRAHGIIRQVAGTHRYLLTKAGRQILTAVTQYQHLTLAQLQKNAA